MHSIRKQDAHQWMVVSLETSNGDTDYYCLFHKLSLATALKLCISLNGGAVQFSETELKVIAMCAA